MYDDVYYNGTKIGTRIKSFLYGTLDGVKLDILRANEVKPCLCGNKAVLIRDGMIEFRFGVFCTSSKCTKYHPTQYRWFRGIDEAVGEWIPHETPDGGEQYECSRCGVLWEFNDGTPEDNEAYFCPKCGAKMKGVKHETD